MSNYPTVQPPDKKAAAIEFLRALEEAGALTPTSLVLTDTDITYERFEALGFFLGRMNRSCAFWIGDWLNFGDDVHGAYTYQAAEVTGLAPQTLANRASVCRKIPPNRRRMSLPFGVHAEVAYLEPLERDRWLDKAELGGWTRAKLREEMRREREELDPMGDLAVTSKTEALDMRSQEEHSDFGVPAAVSHTVDLLGELVSGPIHICPNCGHSFADGEEE